MPKRLAATTTQAGLSGLTTTRARPSGFTTAQAAPSAVILSVAKDPYRMLHTSISQTGGPLATPSVPARYSTAAIMSAPAPHWPDPDVLIVGAGASGGPAAWRLAQAGFKVTCLEQGGWVDPASLPHAQPDWELSKLGPFHPDPNVRRLPADYPIDERDSDFAPLLYNAVGGSTIHWNGHFPRLKPGDFRVRSLDGVADDWPLSYAELEPFYDQNDRFLGVAGQSGDPAQPPRSPRPLPPLPIGRLGELLADGFERLGWHWWPTDAAILSAPYADGGLTGAVNADRQPCNLCGPCELGCPRGSRASTDRTYWPAALALGAELRIGCRVREITLDERGRARGALYYDPQGELREQRASVVILACNGVGTPRLLLNSRSARFPEGLANRSGLVGKNLMFHPFAAVAGEVPFELDSYKGPGATILFSHQFYETDQRRGFLRGYALQAMRQAGPLGTALGGLTAHRLPWGRTHHRAFAERFARTANLAVMGEDLPDPANAVTLHPELTDAHGIPAPKVTYRLSNNSRAMLDHGVARARELLEALGATSITVANPLRASRGHLLGTCRMGDDPAHSVVDRWGRAHDVPNLFVVDGSIFTTAGGVAPTSTIMALALRTADYLAREGRNLGAASP
jgi:choline dehydrogenase-like flavoprotein